MAVTDLAVRLILERTSVFTPLGIRFWDPARNVPVTDDLVVTARPDGAFGRVTPAFRTASGVYAFEGLPGMYTVEHPDVPPEPPAGPPTPQPFLIEVADLQRRFLPILFRVELPLPYRGLFQPA